MSDGLDSGARGGGVYHSPVAACQVTNLGQSYGFHLGANHTHWLHCDTRAQCIDRCLTVDLRDVFHGTTKCAEIDSDAVDGDKMRRYFVPIHRGCKSDTKLVFPAEDREYSAAAIFTIFDEFEDEDSVCVFRHGADVYMRFTITVRMALCGFKLLVHTIDGRVLKLLITDVVTPDYVKIVPTEGLPRPENPSTNGDLYVCFKIEFPKTLSKQSKDEIGDALDRAQP